MLPQLKPDLCSIATGGFDGIVRLVDADSGKLIKRFVAVPLQLDNVVKATR